VQRKGKVGKSSDSISALRNFHQLRANCCFPPSVCYSVSANRDASNHHPRFPQCQIWDSSAEICRSRSAIATDSPHVFQMKTVTKRVQILRLYRINLGH